MILFWLLCALMVVISLMFVIPPLLETEDKLTKDDDGNRRESNVAVYRDQIADLERDVTNGLSDRVQFEQDREELERRLLEDVSAAGKRESDTSRTHTTTRNFAYTLALAIPLLAVALYFRVGNFRSMTSSPVPAGRSASQEIPEEIANETPQGEGQRSQADIEANVSALASRLKENPNDIQGWTMLGRSYMSFEKYAEASEAFAKASALKPNDADLLADYAFALAMANGRQLAGKPAEAINKAIKLDPENAKAIQLAGSVAFEEKDYKRALAYWQKLMAKLPPGSQEAQALSQRIEETKTLAGNIR